MLRNIKLKTRILFVLVFTGALSISLTGWQGYQSAKEALEKSTVNALTAVRDTKKRQIEAYFKRIRNQAAIFSENPMIITAASDFKEAFQRNKFEQDLTGNQIPKIAGDGSAYSRIHSKYHPIPINYLEKFGYYDIFLIDARTGSIVFSVLKEVDFGTNLLNGPYKDTNLAKAFMEARKAPNKDFVKLVDFETYAPSYNAPASFIASPVFDGNEIIGVLAFQIPIDEINRVMTGNRNWEAEGLSRTGETYIVGSDFKMRSDSRFLIEDPQGLFKLLDEVEADEMMISKIKEHSTSVLFQRVYTESTQKALAGESGVNIAKDYRGIQALNAYSPLDIEGVQWAILSKIDSKEAFASTHALKKKIRVIAVSILGIIIILGLLFSSSIVKPIQQLSEDVKKLGKGDLSKRAVVEYKDEIGVLADSFNQMMENLRETTVSKSYVDNILKSMTDALLVVNPSKTEGPAGWPSAKITTVNQSTCNLLGFSEEELIGHPLGNIFPGEELLKRDWYEELMKNDVIRGFKKNMLTKSGERLPVLFSGSVMREQEGNTRGIIYLAQDFTERQKVDK